MPTTHNNAKLGEIAKNVIMPGDPLRAKYIAENFLDNYKLVNDIRNIYTYTGNYKGKELTIMASGMGMPSIGIYSYELYKFYEVENIIRIGSCGSYHKDIKLMDIILSENVYSESNFALTLNNDNCHNVNSNVHLNNIISETASNLGIKIFKGNTVCSDCFDLYMTDVNEFMKRLPKDFNALGVEMESFALFYIAKMLNKNATCLMTVVDSVFDKNSLSSEDRETGLNNMIKLALDSSLKI